MEEINDWIPVKGYEGLYEVSGILGKVRSLNYRNTGRVEILKGGNDGNGYIHLGLSKNGKMRMFKEHRIVVEHFRPNPLNLPEVNHINEDKTDNRACNLEWCDRKYNNNYGTRTERTSKPVLQFTKTGEFVREWPSTHECGRNGFNQGHVAACCRGKLKSHKGFIWRYKPAV